MREPHNPKIAQASSLDLLITAKNTIFSSDEKCACNTKLGKLIKQAPPCSDFTPEALQREPYQTGKEWANGALIEDGKPNLPLLAWRGRLMNHMV